MARLSGSTAEFLSMWLIMMAGKNPFTLNTEGKLQLHFAPSLPGTNTCTYISIDLFF
jgi:hypothetical protein